MAPPSIYSEPKISHKEDTGNVVLEAIVTGSDPAKTTWQFKGQQIEASETYKFSVEDVGGNRRKYTLEILNFDKELSGEYKANFKSADGENFATFNVQSGNAPDFYDKPKIVQRDGGNIICIKIRAKSHLEMKSEWFKDDKPVKSTDRVKLVTKPDDKDKEGVQFLLEIKEPQKSDEAKYKCVVKNAEGQNSQSLNLVFG